MGTNNFNNTRASKIYAVETSYYDEELEETIQDEFIWEDTRDNISYELKEFEKNNPNVKYYENYNISLSEELRSYPAASVGYFYSSFSYAGLDIEINIIPKLVSGYYEGFNLDYEIRLEYEGINYDSIEDILNDFIEYNPEKRGLFKIHSKRLMKILSNDIYFLIDTLELIYERYTTPLIKVAQFSNGEAIYEKSN